VAMAEPSLLCVNCARPPPPHRLTWGRCVRCAELNLPSTYYCGDECAQAHWPKHKVYHKEQKQWVERMREGTVAANDRSTVEQMARLAERTGSELHKRCAAAVALMAEEDHHASAKAWRKIIKDWPDRPKPYFNLAAVLQRSNHMVEAAPVLLRAMELFEVGTEDWATSAASAFDMLKDPACHEVPKPEWWNDEALKALSARVVAVAPGTFESCAMRACVLVGDTLTKAPWNEAPRTAAEVKEAATWYRRAAKVCTGVPADKLVYEWAAGRCDDVADPLLAKEEVEAAKARAAAEAEAAKARAAASAQEAEARKVAEAKAAAAAEELLAEEEQEKQQAASTKASKANHGKGKKGKGSR